MPRSVLLGICFAAGIIIGVLGTSLHGNIWIIGAVETGIVLPWGAALALVLLLLALLWAGTTARALGAPLVLGASTFTVASAAYIWPGADQMVVPFSEVTFDSLPGPVIAGVLWWLGSAAVTLIGLLLVKWILMVDAKRHRQLPAQDR